MRNSLSAFSCSTNRVSSFFAISLFLWFGKKMVVVSGTAYNVQLQVAYTQTRHCQNFICIKRWQYTHWSDDTITTVIILRPHNSYLLRTTALHETVELTTKIVTLSHRKWGPEPHLALGLAAELGSGIAWWEDPPPLNPALLCMSLTTHLSIKQKNISLYEVSSLWTAHRHPIDPTNQLGPGMFLEPPPPLIRPYITVEVTAKDPAASRLCRGLVVVLWW